MPTPTNIQSEIIRHRESNNERLKQMVDDQVNMETTRPVFLRFSAHNYDDAVGLSRMLFAKGMRLIQPEPQQDGHHWTVEVATKHNLRELTQEDFTCDLVTLASGVHATYDCWDFLSNDVAEETQEHNKVPEAQ
ncbi:ribonuclease E inhibitor RraB [Terriglobus aquaticus]|uniref:Ribonuclease E inhibitor RraB n=1 Tax=Terriglobus aquaticus TaxID=940139 RepID=A0ABW9KIZ1_9BACT|nr:ribonuclease E inhibitor RraB [Terriglobus aquaticus]